MEAVSTIVQVNEMYQELPISFASTLEKLDVKHRYGHDLLTIYNEKSFSNLEALWEFLESNINQNVPQINYVSLDRINEFHCYFGSDGTLKWKSNNNILKPDKYIFVMTTTGDFYCGIKEKNSEIKEWFSHSSLGHSLRVAGAGKFRVNEQGKITTIINCSGHYTPTPFSLYQVLLELSRWHEIELNLYVVLLETNDQNYESWRHYQAIEWFRFYQKQINAKE